MLKLIQGEANMLIRAESRTLDKNLISTSQLSLKRHLAVIASASETISNLVKSNLRKNNGKHSPLIFFGFKINGSVKRHHAIFNHG